MIIDAVIFRTVGDVLMGTPVCKAIKDKYPDCRLRFHTEIPYTDLLEGNPYIDDVIGHTVNEPQPGEACIGDIMSVYNWLRSNPGDHLATMAMVNAWDMYWYKQLKHLNNKHHMIDFYAERTGLDIEVKSRHIILPTIPDDHPSNGAAEQIRSGVKKYVCMHVKSGWREKDWELDRFQTMVDWIKKEYGYETIQLGGPRDILLKNVIDGRGKLDARLMDTRVGHIDFKTPQKLIEGCQFYIGGDSGLLYVAEGYSKHAFAPMGGTCSLDEVIGADGKKYPTCPAGPQGPNMHYMEPARPGDSYCRPHSCWSPCKFKQLCVNSILPVEMQKLIKKYIN